MPAAEARLARAIIGNLWSVGDICDGHSLSRTPSKWPPRVDRRNEPAVRRSFGFYGSALDGSGRRI
jgi:hypothetical protein